jgi:hypothetical protein
MKIHRCPMKFHGIVLIEKLKLLIFIICLSEID